ncbi:MAG: TIM barrel protein [Planctomycetaceae bacterium]|nr:TIM barrel protein [Planctomycetaceae bacterium]
MFKCLSPAALGISAPPSDLIEPVLSAGFKALELDVVSFADQAARVGLPAARRLIDSAKLKMGYFRLPFEVGGLDVDFDVAMKGLPAQVQLAAELGCTRVVTDVAPADDLRPLHQNFLTYQQRLQAVAKVLNERGLQLGVGFHATPERRAGRAFEFIRTFDALKLLLGMVGAHNVGVCADLFELWASGASPDAVIDGGVNVVAVFAADAPADVAPDDALQTQRLLPGETGVIDTSAALKALAAAGFDGPVVPMPHPTRFAALSRAAACKQAGDKLEEAFTAAGLTKAKKTSALVR